MVFNNTDEEIGGIQFLYKYPSLYAPYIILTTIGTVIGTFGFKRAFLDYLNLF